jgi:predicted ATPase
VPQRTSLLPRALAPEGILKGCKIEARLGRRRNAMTDNGNHPRPVRTLTVKNFSVIKEAKLEFGKITVLIGPQSSGKSLLSKLAYFLGPILSDLSATFAASDQSCEQLIEYAKNQFRLWFPPYAWRNSTFSIRYEEGLYGVSINASEARGESIIDLSLTENFRDLYEKRNSSIPSSTLRHEDEAVRSMDMSFRRWNFLYALNILQGRAKVENSAYVPAGRSFFSNLNSVFEIFKNENLDPLLKEFAANLDWASTPAGLPLSALKQDVLSAIDVIQGGRFLLKDGKPMFEDETGVQLPMEMVSSGTQELVPLFRIFSKLIRDSVSASGSNGSERLRDHFLIVEEPEAHIFPGTQNKLVRIFSQLTNEPWFSISWLITTHSPYILSAFNNLIEAGQAARNNPTLHDAVAKIIPEQYWIKEGDFKAYAIEDGELKSILNESGFVEGNYLDQVSETIGDEFDRLIKLEYDHAKAS